MPYRELSMLEVREVLRRYANGDGLRAIARGTGLDRKTVAKYITAGITCGVHPGSAPPTDDQVATMLAQRHGPMGGRPGTSQDVLRPHQPQIQAWLAEGLRLTKVYRRLRAQGVAVSYSTLYRFAQTACDFGTPAITVRVADPPPGEAAEVDFGVLGLWPDPTAGIRRRVYGLLVTLCHSRYACLAVVLRQDFGALLDGLELAWTFFGGVVRRLVLDNLTPAVTKADRYTPTLSKVFLEYAQYRGFVVDPTVPVHPTGKPKVERASPTPVRTSSAGRTSATSPACRAARSRGAGSARGRASTGRRGRCRAWSRYRTGRDLRRCRPGEDCPKNDDQGVQDHSCDTHGGTSFLNVEGKAHGHHRWAGCVTDRGKPHAGLTGISGAQRPQGQSHQSQGARSGGSRGNPTRPSRSGIGIPGHGTMPCNLATHGHRSEGHGNGKYGAISPITLRPARPG